MKKTLAIALSTFSLFAAAVSSAGVSLQSGARQEFFEDTRDISGNQTLVPLRIEWSGESASAALLTGFARTEVDAPGSAGRSLSDLLDTKVNLSYLVEGRLPFDLLLGLDLNLPTGQTDLPAADLVLVQDSEIAMVNSFGEGFNVNPTLSVAREWGRWTAGAGAGYTVRRSYDVSTEAGLADFDPGDILSFHAMAQYRLENGYTARLFGTFARFGKDRVRGADFFQEGDFRMAGIGLARAGKKWEAQANLRGTFRARTRIRSAGALVKEPERSRGDEWSMEGLVRYAASPDLSLFASLRGLLVTKNGYEEGSPRFNGKRKKVSFSLGADRRLGKELVGGAELLGFLLAEEAQSVPVPRAQRTTRGLVLAVNVGWN